MINLLHVCYSLCPWRYSVMMCGGLRVQASVLWRGRGLEQHLRMFGVSWQPAHINQIILSFFFFFFFSGLLHLQKLHHCCIPMKHLRFPTRLRFPSRVTSRKHNTRATIRYNIREADDGREVWGRNLWKENQTKRSRMNHTFAVYHFTCYKTHTWGCVIRLFNN